MKQVAIIGAGHMASRSDIIENIIHNIKEKTGEKVILVTGHEQPIIHRPQPCEPLILRESIIDSQHKSKHRSGGNNRKKVKRKKARNVR